MWRPACSHASVPSRVCRLRVASRSAEPASPRCERYVSRGRGGGTMADLTTDYLVVGAGVSGMGFTDALVARADAEVIIVDKRHQPGGHWNNAYPFVRLHQP